MIDLTKYIPKQGEKTPTFEATENLLVKFGKQTINNWQFVNLYLGLFGEFETIYPQWYESNKEFLMQLRKHQLDLCEPKKDEVATPIPQTRFF